MSDTLLQATTAEAAIVTITEKAMNHIKKLRSANQSEHLPLRIFVQAGGCKGMSYGLMFDDQPPEEGDVSFEREGISIIVDNDSVRYLKGAEVDYEDNLIGGGFKIHNPNATKTCGCGSSFKSCG